MREHKLDLTNEPTKKPAGENSKTEQQISVARKFIGMQFDCCGSYARIYLNRDGTAYSGNCPRCGKGVRLKVGPGGTDARFFRAS